MFASKVKQSRHPSGACSQTPILTLRRSRHTAPRGALRRARCRSLSSRAEDPPLAHASSRRAGVSARLASLASTLATVRFRSRAAPSVSPSPPSPELPVPSSPLPLLPYPLRFPSSPAPCPRHPLLRAALSPRPPNPPPPPAFEPPCPACSALNPSPALSPLCAPSLQATAVATS